jgi:hypothetical protein
MTPKLLPEYCPKRIVLIEIDGVERAFFVRDKPLPKSDYCCGCLQPIGRTGSFLRIRREMVCHDQMCFESFQSRVLRSANVPSDEEDGPIDYFHVTPREKVSSKFSNRFYEKMQDGKVKGPTIQKFLKLLRL